MKQFFYLLLFSVLLSCQPGAGKIESLSTRLEEFPDSIFILLNNIKNDYPQFNDKEKALFGLFYFETLNKLGKPMEPKEYIEHSIGYFKRKNTKNYLAKSYLMSGKMYIPAGEYNPKGVNDLLMGIEVCDKNDYNLLAELHFVLGTFSSYHRETELSLKYYNDAVSYYKKAGNKINTCTTLYDAVGPTYLFLDDYEKATECFREISILSSDSVLINGALDEIGFIFGVKAQYDSTMHYLRKGATYSQPLKNTGRQSYSMVDYYYFLSPETQLQMRDFPREMHQYLNKTNINKSDYTILGKLYSALGALSFYQQNMESSFNYYNTAADYYSRIANVDGVARVNSKIGFAYMTMGDFPKSEQSFRKIITTSCDSILIGDALTNISSIFQMHDKNDSALYYLHKSLDYPISAYDRRFSEIADIYSEMEQYDSAKIYYIKMVEEFSSDMYTVVECLEKLKNIELEEGNNEAALLYMKKHNQLLDSIMAIQKQSDIEDVRKIHHLEQEHKKVKMHYWLIVLIAVLLLLFSTFIVHWFIQKNKRQKHYAEKYKKTLEITKKENKQQKKELVERQQKLVDDLKDELARKRANNQEKWKTANFQQREEITKSIYNEVFLLESEDKFMGKMNKTLNNIPAKLKAKYPDISFNDILWCCLFLLDTETNDICLIMNYKITSLYKFKQRLYKKMGFNSAKELETFLQNEYVF